MLRFFLLCLLTSLVSLAAIHDPVKLDGGLVSGADGPGAEVRVFKGIPFAAPPVGDLRWRAPQPAVKWDGVRKADRFSATCMQMPYPAGSIFGLASEPV